MGTDIFYGKGLLHIILTDVFFDQENCGVFLKCFFCILKESFCSFCKSLMEFKESKTVFHCVHNTFLRHIRAGYHKLLAGSFDKVEKLVVQILNLVLQQIFILVAAIF